MEKKALVVGAGLVGSLWSLMLAQNEYEVSLLERRPDPRTKGFVGGRSINLALSTRGWRALEIAGVKDAIMQQAIPMPGRIMHDTSGQTTFQPYGKNDQAIYSVSRGALNQTLIELAESSGRVKTYFNNRCVGFDEDNLRVSFEDPQGASFQLEAPLTFGTDGAFSAIRSTMQHQNRFNYNQSYLAHGYKELHIPPNAQGQHQLDPNGLHIWPRHQFMLIALPNTNGSFTGTLFLPFEGKESFAKLQTEEDIVQFFLKYFPDVFDLIPNLLEEFQENPTSSLVTIKCSPWVHQSKIALIGDASHAIVPFYGQGMNAGFEDCTLLYDYMQKYNHDWTKIFDVYNAVRPQDANAIADLAIRNFVEMRDKVADPTFLYYKKLAAQLHERIPASFIPAYTMVTFSHIPYHKALEQEFKQTRFFEEVVGDRKDINIDGLVTAWQHFV